ncbi:MAG: hypothetical protein GQ533_09205 [Methanosarcinaceae archaeon]|nr:hypothetical protein [Methanosarcinaceae archaeon]
MKVIVISNLCSQFNFITDFRQPFMFHQKIHHLYFDVVLTTVQLCDINTWSNVATAHPTAAELRYDKKLYHKLPHGYPFIQGNLTVGCVNGNVEKPERVMKGLSRMR